MVVEQVNPCALDPLHQLDEKAQVGGYFGDVGVEKGVLHAGQESAEYLEDEGVALRGD